MDIYSKQKVTQSVRYSKAFMVNIGTDSLSKIRPNFLISRPTPNKNLILTVYCCAWSTFIIYDVGKNICITHSLVYSLKLYYTFLCQQTNFLPCVPDTFPLFLILLWTGPFTSPPPARSSNACKRTLLAGSVAATNRVWCGYPKKEPLGVKEKRLRSLGPKHDNGFR